MIQTLHLDQIITCPIREFLTCRLGLPAFLAKLGLLQPCGPLSVSSRVLEGRSIRYCNLGPQSKGGLVQGMVLVKCGRNHSVFAFKAEVSR